MTATAPSISVVVIGRNEQERLGACLRSVLAAQREVNIRDVVYVDAGSEDESVAIASRFGFVRVLRLGSANAAEARNAGWRATKSEQVLFLDGDMILLPGFIARARDVLRDQAVAAVAGFVVEESEGATWASQVFGADWSRATGEVEAVGGSALWRRSALERESGFDDRLQVGEDPDLSHRVRKRGGILLQIETPMVLHRLELRGICDWWRRGISVGLSTGLVARLHGPATRAGRRRSQALKSLWLVLLTMALAFASLRWGGREGTAVYATCLLVLSGAVMLRRIRRSLRHRGSVGLAIAHSFHEQLIKAPLLVGLALAPTHSLDHRSQS